tara:strand:+ start:2047 stop:2694 length:648 start_codon:yes stop_codon:yes gene_type:complete
MVRNNDKTNFYVLGLHNSGTNLTQKIFSDNKNFKFNGLYLWKHRPLLRQHDLDTIEKNMTSNKNFILIITMRDIFTWIKSMKKKIYETNWNKHINSKIDFKCCNDHFKFDSIVHLYESTCNSHKELKKIYPNRVFFCNYYDMICPQKGYEYYCKLCHDIGKIPNSECSFKKILSRKSKSHGNSVSNNIEAMKKMKISLPDDEILLVQKLQSNIKK